MEEEIQWRLPGLFHTDDLVLCGESEEDLKAMVERFVEVCRRRGLKVNTGKGRVMLMNGEEGLECWVHVDGVSLDHVSKFKYLGCVLDEAGTGGPECCRKVAGAISFLVNARDLQLE